MKVAGFTFIRNAVKNDYPIQEAILSILPLCDEFVVAHGNSDDETVELLKSIVSPKLKIINTIWDESKREGGQVFAEETDKAYQAISDDADWAFYIQGDECVHEKYHAVILDEMQQNLDNPKIEGLLFNYQHFYGSYNHYAVSRRWYRREIRILRHLPGIHSYRDAQGFRLNERKINVKLIHASIYHYGWAKPPKNIVSKLRNFNRFYRDDAWIETNVPVTREFDYGNADKLLTFTGSHPQVIQNRISANYWKLDIDVEKLNKKMSFRRRFLQAIEMLTGIRLFEYRNYKIVAK